MWKHIVVPWLSSEDEGMSWIMKVPKVPCVQPIKKLVWPCGSSNKKKKKGDGRTMWFHGYKASVLVGS